MINQLDNIGRPHGHWVCYYDNGELSYKCTFKNGKYHGLLEDYYEDGEVHLKGEYKNNKQRGLWYYK